MICLFSVVFRYSPCPVLCIVASVYICPFLDVSQTLPPDSLEVLSDTPFVLLEGEWPFLGQVPLISRVSIYTPQAVQVEASGLNADQ